MRTATVLLLLATALAACATPLTVRHEPPRESVADFSAARGSEYIAELPFNAGTGYAWTASRFDTKIVRLEGQSSRRAHFDARVGGPMIEEMRFRLLISFWRSRPN